MPQIKNEAVRLSGLLALLMLFAAGCGTPKPKPVAWNISLIKTTPASIEVDLVGVSPIQKPYLANIKVDDYWRPGNSIRAGLKKVTQRLEYNQAWVVKSDDPIWKEWKRYGATELMIMATLPCKDCGDGPFDRRRFFAPLDKNYWNAKKKTLEFEVQKEQIFPLTPQAP